MQMNLNLNGLLGKQSTPSSGDIDKPGEESEPGFEECLNNHCESQKQDRPHRQKATDREAKREMSRFIASTFNGRHQSETELNLQTSNSGTAALDVKKSEGEKRPPSDNDAFGTPRNEPFASPVLGYSGREMDFAVPLEKTQANGSRSSSERVSQIYAEASSGAKADPLSNSKLGSRSGQPAGPGNPERASDSYQRVDDLDHELVFDRAMLQRNHFENEVRSLVREQSRSGQDLVSVETMKESLELSIPGFQQSDSGNGSLLFGQSQQQGKSSQESEGSNSAQGEFGNQTNKVIDGQNAFEMNANDSLRLHAGEKVQELDALVLAATNPSNVGLGTQVINQLVDQLSVDGLGSGVNGSEDRQLKVQIYPEELGQLEITVTKSDEGLVAHISATELITSELLIREKEQLLEALADKGFDFPSIDISHREQQGHSRDETQQDSWNQQSSEWNIKPSATINRARVTRSSSLIDVLV